MSNIKITDKTMITKFEMKGLKGQNCLFKIRDYEINFELIIYSWN